MGLDVEVDLLSIDHFESFKWILKDLSRALLLACIASWLTCHQSILLLGYRFCHLELAVFNDVKVFSLVTFLIQSLVLDHAKLFELIGQLAQRRFSELTEERDVLKELDLFIQFLFLYLA